MEKVNDLITLLKNYSKIVEITGGNQVLEANQAIEILKKYKHWSLDKFQQKLEGECLKSKSSKVSPRQQALDLGSLYYKLQTTGAINEEERRILSTYLALPENQVLMSILHSPFDQSYKIINELPEKSLVINHLAFLGMALLNIKLKSGSKSVQKKNLLDVLWKVIENQQMNEIYVSAL